MVRKPGYHSSTPSLFSYAYSAALRRRMQGISVTELLLMGYFGGVSRSSELQTMSNKPVDLMEQLSQHRETKFFKFSLRVTCITKSYMC